MRGSDTALTPRNFDIPSNATHADFRAWESNHAAREALYGNGGSHLRGRVHWSLLIGAPLVAIALLLLLFVL